MSLIDKIPLEHKRDYLKGYSLCRKKIENNYYYNSLEYELECVPARNKNKCSKCDGKNKSCEDYGV